MIKILQSFKFIHVFPTCEVGTAFIGMLQTIKAHSKFGGRLLSSLKVMQDANT